MKTQKLAFYDRGIISLHEKKVNKEFSKSPESNEKKSGKCDNCNRTSVCCGLVFGHLIFTNYFVNNFTAVKAFGPCPTSKLVKGFDFTIFKPPDLS